MSKDLNEYMIMVTIIEANKDKKIWQQKERSNLWFYYKDRENTSQVEAMLDWYDSSLISGIPFMLMMTR